jgi:hypothetical protein
MKKQTHRKFAPSFKAKVALADDIMKDIFWLEDIQKFIDDPHL